jgi:hypothetical protein
MNIEIDGEAVYCLNELCKRQEMFKGMLGLTCPNCGQSVAYETVLGIIEASLQLKKGKQDDRSKPKSDSNPKRSHR